MDRASRRDSFRSKWNRAYYLVECRVTFVAMDDARKPTPVPPLLLETDADRAAQTAAEERRRARLAKR